MFSAFFKARYNSKEPFLNLNKKANKNTKLFLEWIKTEMN